MISINGLIFSMNANEHNIGIIPEKMFPINEKNEYTVCMTNSDFVDMYNLDSAVKLIRQVQAASNIVLRIFHFPYSEKDCFRNGFAAKMLCDSINAMKFNRVEVVDSELPVPCMLDNSVNMRVPVVEKSESGLQIKYQDALHEGKETVYPIDEIVYISQQDADIHMLSGVYNTVKPIVITPLGNGKIHVPSDADFKDKRIAVTVRDAAQAGEYYASISDFLRKKGAKEVYLIATHISTLGTKTPSVLSVIDKFDRIITTNSYMSEEMKDMDKLGMVSVGACIPPDVWEKMMEQQKAADENGNGDEPMEVPANEIAELE